MGQYSTPYAEGKPVLDSTGTLSQFPWPIPVTGRTGRRQGLLWPVTLPPPGCRGIQEQEVFGAVVQCTSGTEVLMPAVVNFRLVRAATSTAHDAPS